jgi:diguanylate cyclase (GGDEF)-like protein
VFARYGGEEFALILRGIDIVGARAAGERLRSQIEKLAIQSDRGSISVTISVGCASLSTSSEPTTEMLIQTADRRLYAAKNGGRNRVVASD